MERNSQGQGDTQRNEEWGSSCLVREWERKWRPTDELLCQYETQVLLFFFPLPCMYRRMICSGIRRSMFKSISGANPSMKWNACLKNEFLLFAFSNPRPDTLYFTALGLQLMVIFIIVISYTLPKENWLYKKSMLVQRINNSKQWKQKLTLEKQKILAVMFQIN